MGNYSKDQISTICNSDCAQNQSSLTWSREITYDFSQCGGLPPVNNSYYVSVCTNVGKEYITRWFDSDPLSCTEGAAIKTVQEWWINCGCSSITLNHKCSNYSAAPSTTKAKLLLNSNDSKERTLGVLYSKFAGWIVRDEPVTEIVPIITKSVISGYSDNGFNNNANKFIIAARVYAAAIKENSPDNKIDSNAVLNMAKSQSIAN